MTSLVYFSLASFAHVGTRLHLVPIIPAALTCRHIFGRGSTSSKRSIAKKLTMNGIKCEKSGSPERPFLVTNY